MSNLTTIKKEFTPNQDFIRKSPRIIEAEIRIASQNLDNFDGAIRTDTRIDENTLY